MTMQQQQRMTEGFSTGLSPTSFFLVRCNQNAQNQTNNQRLEGVQGVHPTAEKRVRKDEDFYGWLLDQARVIRSYRASDPHMHIDWEDLAEELDGMARNEKRGLRSQIRRVLIHLLKWQYQPEQRSDSWEETIRNGRDEVADYLRDSPSLRTGIGEVIAFAYRAARRKACVEIGWDKRECERVFPASCPWELNAHILNEDFFPGSA